jgi:hypothetical protein
MPTRSEFFGPISLLGLDLQAGTSVTAGTNYLSLPPGSPGFGQYGVQKPQNLRGDYDD